MTLQITIFTPRNYLCGHLKGWQTWEQCSHTHAHYSWHQLHAAAVACISLLALCKLHAWGVSCHSGWKGHGKTWNTQMYNWNCTFYWNAFLRTDVWFDYSKQQPGFFCFSASNQQTLLLHLHVIFMTHNLRYFLARAGWVRWWQRLHATHLSLTGRRLVVCCFKPLYFLTKESEEACIVGYIECRLSIIKTPLSCTSASHKSPPYVCLTMDSMCC